MNKGYFPWKYREINIKSIRTSTAFSWEHFFSVKLLSDSFQLYLMSLDFGLGMLYNLTLRSIRTNLYKKTPFKNYEKGILFMKSQFSNRILNVRKLWILILTQRVYVIVSSSDDEQIFDPVYLKINSTEEWFILDLVLMVL